VILALDVGYHDHFARVAIGRCLTLGNLNNFSVKHYDFPLTPAAYIPGQFYQRELPLLLLGLAHYSTADISLIIIDGYVDLKPEHPGLGAYLDDALLSQIPIIGVAKSYYQGTSASSILRGKSKTPLYISSRGISNEDAADFIRQLPGPYRIPNFLKAVDMGTKVKG